MKINHVSAVPIFHAPPHRSKSLCRGTSPGGDIGGNETRSLRQFPRGKSGRHAPDPTEPPKSPSPVRVVSAVTGRPRPERTTTLAPRPRDGRHRSCESQVTQRLTGVTRQNPLDRRAHRRRDHLDGRHRPKPTRQARPAGAVWSGCAGPGLRAPRRTSTRSRRSRYDPPATAPPEALRANWRRQPCRPEP